MGKPCTSGTMGERENCGKLGLMDKTHFWSSQPACSQVNKTTPGSRMVVEGRDDTDADAGGEAFRAGISTFEYLRSTLSRPGLSLRFMIVATDLGGGEECEKVDDIEPQWLLVRMEGE